MSTEPIEWTVDLAYSRFSDPGRAPRPRREAELLESGRPFEFEVADRTVVGHTFGEGKPLLLMHGWGGRGTQYRPWVEPCLEAGYQVILPDAPAHGDSSGDWSTMFYFGKTVLEVSKRWDLYGAVCHSISATATPWAVTQGARIPRLAIIAPTFGVYTFFDKFVERVGVPKEIADGVKARWKVEYGEDYLLKAGLEFTLPQVEARGLVIHDTTDTEASVEDGRMAHQVWAGSEYFETTGLGHLLVMRNEAVIRRTLEFLGTE